MMRVLPLLAGATTAVAVWVLGRSRTWGPQARMPTGIMGAPIDRVPGHASGPVAVGRPTAASAANPVGFAAGRLLGGVGRVLRRLARRPPDPGRDRRVGWVAVVALVAAPVSPLASVLVAVGVWCWPVLQRRRGARARDRCVVDELPDVIDLVRIAIDGGLTVHDALVGVVAHGHGTIVDALAGVLVRVQQGERLGDALPAARVLGPAAEGFVDTLVAAERYGAAASRQLDRAATEARVARRRRGEEAARRVPVKMLFPLVLCTLPALGLLTVLPLLARSLPSLAP